MATYSSPVTSSFTIFVILSLEDFRLDYQPLVGKGVRVLPPNSLLGQERSPHTREAEIKPRKTLNKAVNST